MLSVCFLALESARRQVRFIRETLASDTKLDDRRIIASLSTVPERIGNLGPTIRSLLRQTRPPDEIVLAIPEFSIREQRPYAVPKHVSRWPRMRILHCRRDWGPATKFIPIVRDELAAGRGDTLIMVVDDDRIYPRDALETYLHYSKQLPDAALCFRGARNAARPGLADAKMIRAKRGSPTATRSGDHRVRKLFNPTEVLRRITLGLFPSARSGAFYMDDIWISGWLARRSVKRYVVPASAMMRSVFRQRRTLSLHDVPNGRQYNNNETIAFFGEAGTSSLRINDVCLCDGYGAATIEHQRLPGKPQR